MMNAKFVNDQKLRDDMIFLHGQIEAMGFLAAHRTIEDPLYNLWESVSCKYEKIMNRILDIKQEPTCHYD